MLGPILESSDSSRFTSAPYAYLWGACAETVSGLTWKEEP